MRVNDFINTDIEIIDGDRGTNYPSKTEFWDDEYCLFLDSGNVTPNGFDFSKTHFITKEKDEILRNGKLQRNDIVMTTRGSVGNIALYDETVPYNNVRINSGMIILRCHEEYTPVTLYYILKSKYIKSQILNIMSGSVQKQLPVSAIEMLKIPVSSNEMVSSLDIIRTIDRCLVNNSKICFELESMAKTLYDYWFVQFDFPDKSGKPYCTSGGKMVWNEQLQRRIPLGWTVGTLSQYIAGDKNGDWGKESPEGNYTKRVSCVRGADFPSLNSSKPLKAPTRFILDKNAYKCLNAGDIIVEISGGSPTQSTGRICYINGTTLRRFENEIITSNFCRAFSTTKRYHQYWFYILWKSLYDAGVLFGYEGKTTGIKNLLFDVFTTQYKIAIPDEHLVESFNKIVSPIFEKIQMYNTENDELTKLRDWLLPMLMNGQATVE